MLKYSDLTDKERTFVSNGCGSKGGWIKPPQLIFEEDCKPHDFDYWRGCSEAHRILADKSFYVRMKKSVSKLKKWYRKGFYYSWAWVYYKVVKYRGHTSFHYDFEMKTYANLRHEIKRKQNEKKTFSGT